MDLAFRFYLVKPCNSQEDIYFPTVGVQHRCRDRSNIYRPDNKYSIQIFVRANGDILLSALLAHSAHILTVERGIT